MASTPQAPPPDGAERVGRAVAALAAVERPFSASAEAGGAAATLSAPIPVYALGVPEADSEPAAILERAAHRGWRYLVFNSGGPAVADLRGGEASHPVLDETPQLAERIVEAGKVAEDAVAGASDYEMRLLDLPLIGRSLLWAASPEPDRPDRLFSLDGRPVEVDRAKLLREVSAAERAKAVAFSAGSDEAGGQA